MASKTKIADPRLQLRRTQIRKETQLLINQLVAILPRGLGPYEMRGQGESGLEAQLALVERPGLAAPRQRGGDVPVVPLLTQNLDSEFYWISVYLSWTESDDPNSLRLIYQTAGITLFQGQHADFDKLQLLRVEWPGLRYRTSDGAYVFEAPGAGHPHWHIDALQHRLLLRKSNEDEREELFRSLQGGAKETTLNDLLTAVQSSGESQMDDERYIAWTRMHLAQRALWAQQPLTVDTSSDAPHAMNPEDFAQVRNWIISTLIYIRQEIERSVW